MNDLGPDFVVLLLGVLLTFVIGTLLLQAGRPYLEQVFPEPRVAKGVDRLLTVLFLLVTLGFLALITTADFGIDGVYERVMVKLGLVLLTIGATYGLMMFVVSQIRARRKQEQISDEISAQLAHQHLAADPQPPTQVPTGLAPSQVPEEPPPGGYAPPPGGPYASQQPGGAYTPQQPGGAYTPQQRGGAYQPQQPGSAPYQPDPANQPPQVPQPPIPRR